MSARPTAVVTGSGGLIGSEAVRQLCESGYQVVGIDNDMRRRFFGAAGSTRDVSRALWDRYHPRFTWKYADIRSDRAVDKIFKKTRPALVVHAAAQPSHDWAAREPLVDFGVNATGTLNLLEATRRYTPEATFAHCSTSKVYGDNPNRLSLLEGKTRYDLRHNHRYYRGIDTTMSIDGCLHSLFGVSKASGDLLVQEYGRYFGMNTVCLRPGCLTGADHAGVELHGFLAYLGKCVARGLRYRVIGYKGKQVRCNIHAEDLVGALLAFHSHPVAGGATYNIGGGRANSCSVLEAIEAFEGITGRTLDWEYVPETRIGDHQWWISSNAAFEQDFPDWRMNRTLGSIYEEIAGRYS